jgi:hypothetical protein
MSNTPEGKVKRKGREWLKQNMPDHWFLSPMSGPWGKNGTPDWIICWLGVFIAIEVKADDGVVSSLQMAQLELITKAGGVAAVLRGYDVARLEAIKQAALDIVNGRSRQ